jgi:hypothetical protein
MAWEVVAGKKLMRIMMYINLQCSYNQQVGSYHMSRCLCNVQLQIIYSALAAFFARSSRSSTIVNWIPLPFGNEISAFVLPAPMMKTLATLLGATSMSYH